MGEESGVVFDEDEVVAVEVDENGDGGILVSGGEFGILVVEFSEFVVLAVRSSYTYNIY